MGLKICSPRIFCYECGGRLNSEEEFFTETKKELEETDEFREIDLELVDSPVLKMPQSIRKIQNSLEAISIKNLEDSLKLEEIRREHYRSKSSEYPIELVSFGLKEMMSEKTAEESTRDDWEQIKNVGGVPERVRERSNSESSVSTLIVSFSNSNNNTPAKFIK